MFSLKHRESLPSSALTIYTLLVYFHTISYYLYACQSLQHSELLKDMTEYSPAYAPILAQCWVQMLINVYINSLVRVSECELYSSLN